MPRYPRPVRSGMQGNSPEERGAATLYAADYCARNGFDADALAELLDMLGLDATEGRDR